MANKIVKSEIFEINISSLNKAQKIIYNKVSNSTFAHKKSYVSQNLYLLLTLL